jgi:hypothetical protein
MSNCLKNIETLRTRCSDRKTSIICNLNVNCRSLLSSRSHAGAQPTQFKTFKSELIGVWIFNVFAAAVENRALDLLDQLHDAFSLAKTVVDKTMCSS